MRTETRTYTLYRITELSEEAKELTRTAKPLMPFANASVSCAVIGDMTHVIIAMTTAAGRKTA